MSAERALVDAVAAALGNVSGLNRVAPGASVRASPPYAEIGPVVAVDWGTKDRAGREVRVTVTVRDLAERAARLHGLADAVQAAVTAMPRDLAGWRMVSLNFVKSRIGSEKAGDWAAAIEWRARVLAAD